MSKLLKGFLMAIGAVVILVAVSMCATGRTAGSDRSTGGAAPVAEQNLPGPEESSDRAVEGAYGVTLASDDLSITAKAPQDKSNALGKYTCITVTLQNTSSVEQRYGPFDFKLQDPNGNQALPTIAGFKNPLSVGSLAKGGKVTGDVCFDKTPVEGQTMFIYDNVFADDLVWK